MSEKLTFIPFKLLACEQMQIVLYHKEGALSVTLFALQRSHLTVKVPSPKQRLTPQAFNRTARMSGEAQVI